MKSLSRWEKKHVRQKRFYLWIVAILAIFLGGTVVYFKMPVATPNKAAFAVVPANTFNLLFTLTDTDSKAPLAFVLVGVNAPKKQIMVTPLPTYFAAQNTQTLFDVYNSSGPTRTAAVCSDLLRVPVDYYWSQDSATFASVIDRYGGIDPLLSGQTKANVPHEAQVQIPDGRQHLNGVQAEAILGYAHYGNMEKRLRAQATIVQTMIKEKCTTNYLDEDKFGSLFDLSRTNFSLDAFLSNKQIIRSAILTGGIKTFLPTVQEKQGVYHATTETSTEIQENFGRQNRRYS